MSIEHSLALRGLSHSYGGAQAALMDVSLEVAPGELLALLGPSGCGKTTLLRAVAGFIRPDEGEVLVDGVQVTDQPASLRNVGIVFQNYALFPHMTVADNVAYGLRARRAGRALVAERVAQMLEMVQMQTYADRLPKALSGGQQQRVALARALAVSPRIVLLDEPFSALDRSLRLDMQIEIKRLLKAQGQTAILVTHDQEEALSMADRIAVLNAGKVEQVASPAELYDRPASLFVNTFVGRANLLPGQIVALEGGRARVALEAGVTLSAPLRGDPVPGARVLCSVRPENFQVVPEGTPGALVVRVGLTLPLGADEVLEARAADGTALKIVRHRSFGTVPITPDSSIGLAVADPAAVNIFADPESRNLPSTRQETAA